MSSKTSNVVRLSGGGRDPAHRIIGECRDRLANDIGNWLQGIGTAVAEELFVLADGTRDRTKQTQFLNLRRDVENEWSTLVTGFRRAFLQDTAPNEVALEVPSFDGLALIDDAELSETIVIREFSARIAETCDEELYGLDRRIALILDDIDAEDINHPLRPESICEALASACTSITTETDNRTLLLRRIERHLHSALPGIYHTVNAYLVDMGLLPDLKRTYRRAQGESSPSSADIAYAASLANAFPAAPAPVGESADFLGTLQRLAAARSNGALPAMPTLSSTMFSGPMPQGFALPAGFIPGNSMGAIGEAAPGAAIADAAALSQAFFASLEQFRVSDEMGTTNQIHMIRSSDAARQVGHVEAVTIDIVAMLFDFIFDDKEVPDGVKSLVGRLQIPVLKLAMQDETFFASRHHPARHFLDEISGIAVRWGGNVDTEDPFYRVLADLISRIQDSFENDVEIFSRSLEELQQFVDSQTQEEDHTASAATVMGARREREVAAWERAQSAVQAINEQGHPAFLKNFVQNQWLPVLQKLALEHDVQSTAWTDAIALPGDIARSIVPKKGAEERMSLIKVLPTLLGRINRGLDLASEDKTERRPFFDTLVDLHTAALKGEQAATPVAEKPQDAEPSPAIQANELPPPTATDFPEGDLIVTRSLANGVEVEEITLVGAKPSWRADDRDVSRRVALLERGDWVEFRQEDGPTIRERLTWISPQRRILVFSNHRASKALSIAPEALSHLIRSGKAALIEEDSIFERAMNGVLENLNAA